MGGRIVGAMLDQPGSVLGDYEIEIVLVRTFEFAAAENQSVVIGVSAWFDQCECALDCVRPRRRVGRIPVRSGLRIGGVKSGPHRHELDGARTIRVRRGGAAIDPDLPSLRRLRSRQSRNRKHEYGGYYRALHVEPPGNIDGSR